MKKEILVLTALIALLSGCGTMNKNNATNPHNRTGNIKTHSVNQQQQPIVNNYHNKQNHEEAAAHLKKLAKGVKGVKDAHVVMMGNTAVVGLDVDANLERSRVGTIKYSVAEAFRKNPYGVTAVVTADMDLGQRIKEIGQDISAGKPIVGFSEELSDIVARIVPQVPNNLMPNQTENQHHMNKNNVMNRDKAMIQDNAYSTPDNLMNDYERRMIK